jgi:hypothetical protein
MRHQSAAPYNGGARFQGHLWIGDDAGINVCKPRITRLDGFGPLTSEHLHDIGWHLNAVARKNGYRIGAARRVRHGRAGGDIDRIIARNIGYEQGHHAPASTPLQGVLL